MVRANVLGPLIMGWGLFHLVEGILNHHILNIHHVVERLELSVFDYAFLASGIVFISIGLGLIRSGAGDTPSTHPGPATR